MTGSLFAIISRIFKWLLTILASFLNRKNEPLSLDNHKEAGQEKPEDNLHHDQARNIQTSLFQFTDLNYLNNESMRNVEQIPIANVYARAERGNFEAIF
jgi:hypothetical protein